MHEWLDEVGLNKVGSHAICTQGTWRLQRLVVESINPTTVTFRWPTWEVPTATTDDDLDQMLVNGVVAVPDESSGLQLNTNTAPTADQLRNAPFFDNDLHEWLRSKFGLEAYEKTMLHGIRAIRTNVAASSLFAIVKESFDPVR